MAYIPKREEKTGFKTTALLASGATYTSVVLDVDGETQVQTEILASHDGTIAIDFCADGTCTDIVRSLTIPYVAANGYQFFSAPAFVNHIRYKFTNDAGVTQTDFYYTTKLLSTSISPQLLTTNAFISPAMVSTLNRSIFVGQDEAGNFRNAPVDTEGHQKVNINDPTSAFGDLRTAELSPTLQYTFSYNINSDLWDTTEANSGTVTQSTAMAVLSTSTNAAGSASMASKKVLKYRAGLGMMSRFTGLFTTGVADSIQIIGIGNDEDGLFFGYDGVTFGILRRSNSSDTWIPQTTWNVDVLDGSGSSSNPSGETLDPTKINVFEIEIQYLGAGELTYKIENSVTGELSIVHREKYTNANTVPSMYIPILPLYAEVTNSGNTSDLILKTASMAGFIEGKDVISGPTNSIENSKTTVSTLTNIATIRNKTSFASKTNRNLCYLQGLSVAVDGTKNATVRIVKNASLGGTPSYTDISTNTSVIDYDTAGTTVTGGTQLPPTVLSKVDSTFINLTDLDLFIAPGETVTFAVESTANTDTTVGIGWVEDL